MDMMERSPLLPQFVVASVMLATCSASIASETPQVLIKTAVDDVLNVVRQTRDRRTLRALAEQKVLPHFDFQRMTRLAVGRHWNDASPAQQQALETGFRSLLVNTYVAAVSRAEQAERSVEVLSSPPAKDARDVVVRTRLSESGGRAFAIDYRMADSPSGWKVYDIVVEGVSLVTTYRGTFEQEIRRSGMDGLVKALEDKSRALSAG